MVAFKFKAKDGTNLLFREPGPNDAAQLMRFINVFVAEPRSGLLINRRATLKQEKVWLNGWLADIKSRKGVMLLVESEGRIEGNCTVNRLPWKCSHVGDVGIALSQGIRGKGVGMELMTRTIELARRRMSGLEILTLKTFDYNQRAQALYKKMGFVEVGRVPKGIKEGTEYFDDLTMVKILRNG